MIGDINKQTPISAYQPSSGELKLIKQVKKDYNQGAQILTRSWVELNDRSVVDDANTGQMMFNAYVDTSVEDPNEAWKWRGTRSLARNKGIAMHAQLTANYLIPLYEAQNKADEMDRGFSEVMRHIIEWMCQPNNSNYQPAILQVAFGMMYNPVTYLGAEYCEVFQKIKEMNDKGYKTKEVLDEVLSGFKAKVYGPTQILLTNAYERNIQRQRAIIQRRFTDYSELEAKYGDHKNWDYVQKGIKSIYNEEDGLFYDIKDEDCEGFVAEEIWKHRREDYEVPFVNGIYLGDDNVDDNPIKHRDQVGAPKYNVTPFGYMRINEHFAYYKSMMAALKWDNMAYDAMSEIIFNRAVLENEMPLAVSGVEPGKVDSNVVFPGSVTVFENQDAKVNPLLPNSNAIAGFNALAMSEKSASESSVSDTVAGQLPEASQKAYNVAQARADAKRMIGAIGKSYSESIIQFGDLMKDIALNHITMPQVEELVGGNFKLKYKSFFLEGKKSSGKVKTLGVKFDEGLIGKKMTDKEKERYELELLEKSDYPNDKESLRYVNPEAFRKFKYLTKVDLQEMFDKNNEYWQPILMALKSQFAQDPYIDQKALTHEVFYSHFASRADEFIKDGEVPIPGMPQGLGNQFNNMAVQQASAQATNQPIV